MSKPNVIINLPMEIPTLVKIGKACPKESVLVQTDDQEQVHVYFDPKDVPERGDERC